jgi:hypothetical protein
MLGESLDTTPWSDLRRRPPAMRGSCEYIEKVGRSVCGLNTGLTTLHRKKLACYEKLKRASDLDKFFG